MGRMPSLGQCMQHMHTHACVPPVCVCTLFLPRFQEASQEDKPICPRVWSSNRSPGFPVYPHHHPLVMLAPVESLMWNNRSEPLYPGNISFLHPKERGGTTNQASKETFPCSVLSCGFSDTNPTEMTPLLMKDHMRGGSPGAE